jgi:hypothetical protein
MALLIYIIKGGGLVQVKPLIRRQAGSRDVESTVVKKIKKKLAT